MFLLPTALIIELAIRYNISCMTLMSIEYKNMSPFKFCKSNLDRIIHPTCEHKKISPTGSHRMSAFSGILIIVCCVLLTLKSIIVQRFASTDAPSSVYSLWNSSIMAKSWTIHSRNVFKLSRGNHHNQMNRSFFKKHKKKLTRTKCKTESCKRGMHSWNLLAQASQTFAWIRRESRSAILKVICRSLWARCHLF